jgi:hypothetical protein
MSSRSTAAKKSPAKQPAKVSPAVRKKKAPNGFKSTSSGKKAEKVYSGLIATGDIIAYAISAKDKDSGAYMMHGINALKERSNEMLNDIGINFAFPMRDPKGDNSPAKGANGHFKQVFVKIIGEHDDITPEQFGSDVAAALSEIDEWKEFEFANNITNSEKLDPACLFFLDKDVTEMAFSGYGDDIRDGSFFDDAELVQSYWGDHPNPKQVMKQYRDF